MLENVIELLKKRNIVIPGSLFFNTKKIGITNDELYFLAYAMNLNDLSFDMIKIGKELGMKPKDVLKIVNDLSEKNLVKLDVVKKDLDVNEYLNLDGLYHKMAFIMMGKEEPELIDIKVTLYDTFEQEFKRPLTPREIQIINAWKDVGYSDELITLALKEAVYNEAYSVAYIDKILNNWDKKGIKNKDDVEKNREDFNKQKVEIIDMDDDSDYDWLHE